MIDPRPAVFRKRLDPVRRIVALGGGKGGVGKTTITCLTALGAASAERRVGLLDLDLHGGAAHLFLGITPSFPDEEGGILPLTGPRGIYFMSATAFSGDRPLALRGGEVTDAIAELLAVTIWPELDLLLVDLPPGLGEGVLDLLRFMPRAEIIAVTTPSIPSVQVADRFLQSVRSQARVLGVVANMVAPAIDGNDTGILSGSAAGARVGEIAGRHGVPILASVPLDDSLEDSIGRPGALAGSAAAAAVAGYAAELARGT